MFAAYLDESNSNLQGKVCVVAGFIGTEPQWESFVKDWVQTLGRKKSLHMKDLRWKDGDRDLLARLGILPEKHGLKQVASVVRNEDYSKIVKGKIRDRYANPYMLAAQMCLAQILRRVPQDEPVAIYFEEQSVYKWRVEELSESVPRLNPGRLLSISTLKKEHCVAFQAADYLSYATSQLREKPHGLRARWSKPILGDGDCIGVDATPEMIQFYVDTCVSAGMRLETV
ncbi:MAG TPA: DUF3800 domain-containing protein [Candidatus Acidoferrum sp.]|nr:DUF3800 domain-containing protein [Candidatus Acidoferrum sp.]